MLRIALLLAFVYCAYAAYIRGCAYVMFAQYRSGRAKFVPENYSSGKCTHIFYAHGCMGDDFKAIHCDESEIPSSWGGEGLYARVNKLKSSDPGLKTILSVGGWEFLAERFQGMAENEGRRIRFVESLVLFARKYDFDGLDIDWEFPEGVADLFTLFISDLRVSVDQEVIPAGKQKLIFTATVSGKKAVVDTAYNISSLVPLLDFINLLSFDYSTGWEDATGLMAPLYSRASDAEKTLNVAYGANYWVQKGFPASKIAVGVGAYGRGYTLADKANSGIGAAVLGPSDPTAFLGEPAVAAYYELCEMIAQGAVRTFDAESQVPYLSLGNQWFGYEDVQSITAKLQWIKSNKFAGAYLWSLDQDDFNGQCSNGGGLVYPITSEIQRQLP